ncbi:hypothetical protein ATCCBAA256_33340, partial [Mycobacterium montefiorense]
SSSPRPEPEATTAMATDAGEDSASGG